VQRRSILIVLVLALIVAACGSADTAETEAPLETEAPPTTAAPETTTTTTVPETTTTTVPETTTTTIDLAAAEATMRGQIAEMIDEVERITQKEFAYEPSVIIGTPEQMRARLVELYEEEVTEEELKVEESFLVSLGAITPDRDWVGEALENQAGGVVGFYDPDTEELWVTNRGTKFGPYALSVVVHELHHALQDQLWDLSSFDYLYDEERWEEYEALTMLIEGEARYVEDQYLNTFDEQQRLAYNSEAGSFGGGRPQPAIIQFVTLAYYKDGRGFVEDLYEEGGWDAVDAVWANPPTTTEQAKHTNRYLEGEQPIPVDIPDLGIEGYELYEEDTWGENDFIGMFAVEDVGAAGVLAATKWGGDEYQIYWNVESETTVLVIGVVGDDEEATANYLEGLTVYRDKVEKTEDEIAVFESGGLVYFVASEDPVGLAGAVAALGG
jgi:hypothetical protein